MSGSGSTAGDTVTATVQGSGETCTTTVAGDGSWSCDLSPSPSEGAVVIDVIATDPVGNDSTATTVNATIDTTDPADPTVDFPTSGGSTDGTVSGSGAGPGETITITVQGTGETCTDTVAGDGSWSCDLAPTPSAGAIIIDAIATDPAGNPSGTTIVNATVDLTPPSAPTITSHVDNDVDNNPTVLAGACEAGGLVSISHANLNPNPTTTLCDGGGAYSVSLTWLPAADANTETLSVTQSDVAGNPAGSSVTVAIAVDLTAPAAPTITSHVDDDPDNNPTTLTGACETDATVVISNANLNPNPTQTTCVGGTYNVDLTWNPGADGATQTLSLTQRDIAGNVSTSSSVDIASDLTPPSVTGTIDETVGDTTAIITWTTDEPTSSEVVYGLTSTTDQTTGETDIAPRVTSHTGNLTGLLACTTYFYQTVSRDAAGNQLSSAIDSFTTTGCVGDTTITAEETTNVVNSGVGNVGAPVELDSGTTKLQIEAPAGYAASAACAGGGAYFQLKDLDKPPVIQTLGYPSTDPLDTVKAYELSAYCDPTTRVTTFDQPISITLEYSNDDIEGISESTIRIYHYNKGASAWEQLPGCTVDHANNTVTCTTTAFSTFGIFGSLSRASGGGSNTQRYSVEVCDYDHQQCGRRYPVRDSLSLNDPIFAAYETCIRSGGGTGYQCTKAWAETKGYTECSNDAQCRTGETASSLDLMANLFRANPTSDPVAASEELLGSADLVKLSNEVTTQEGNCRKVQYVRFPQYRGRGVGSDKFQDASAQHYAYPALIDLAEQVIVTGDDQDGFARLDSPITRGETMKIFTIARQDSLLLDECLAHSRFPDVKDTMWFHNFVQNMEQNNIVHGYDDGYYRPGDTVKKAEILKITALSFGFITKAEADAIAAANDQLWYEPYAQAVALSINLPESITEVSMNEPLSRGQVFAILSEALQVVDR